MKWIVTCGHHVCNMTLLPTLENAWHDMIIHDKRQAGSWVSRIPHREQVQVHASMNPSTTSSVASLGNIGRWAVAPLLIPFDSGLSTHSLPLGHDLANQKMVLNLACCFPRCCVVTWNMVLKCLWRCVACSNTKPREVSWRSAQVPRKRPITANHCIRISGCSASNQRPTKKAGNGMVFPSVLGCDMERGAQIISNLCVHGSWVSPMRCGGLPAPTKTKGSFTAFSSISTEEGWQKQTTASEFPAVQQATNDRQKRLVTAWCCFSQCLVLTWLLGEHESWMTRWNLGMKNLYTGEFWACNLANSEKFCFCWRILDACANSGCLCELCFWQHDVW